MAFIGFDPDNIGDLLDEYELVECIPLDEDFEIPPEGVCRTEIVEAPDGSEITTTFCSPEIFDPSDYPIVDPIVDILNTPPFIPPETSPPINPRPLPPPYIDPFQDGPFGDPYGGANPPIGSSPAPRPPSPGAGNTGDLQQLPPLVPSSDSDDLNIGGGYPSGTPVRTL